MRKIAMVAGAAALLIVGAQSAAAETIKIPLHNWSSQLVGARIVGKMLEMVGEKVDYVSADSQVVYTSMCEGDIHLVHEVWQGAFGVSYEKQLNKGCVMTANTHEAKTREEWWYPEYVEKACPGLPDWKALNKCAAKFATASTKPKGRFLAGPVDWLKHDQERVDGLGMNFKVVNAGSARRAVGRTEVGQQAQGRRSCCSTGRRTSSRPCTRASSWSSRPTTRNAARIPSGA